MDTFTSTRAPRPGQSWPALHPETAKEAAEAALSATIHELEKTQSCVMKISQLVNSCGTVAVSEAFALFETQLEKAERAAQVYDRLHSHLLDSLYAYDCLYPDIAQATSKWCICSDRISSSLNAFAQLRCGGAARQQIESAISA